MASDRRKVSWIQRAEFPTKSITRESGFWRPGDIASDNLYTIAVDYAALIQTHKTYAKFTISIYTCEKLP